MKRNIAIALFGLASLAAASGAFAEDSGAQVNVPFAFSVSNTTLPAGQYRASSQGCEGAVTLRPRPSSPDHHTSRQCRGPHRLFGSPAEC